MASSEEDYYALLGVTYDATIQQIKKAYRKKALKYHPDKVGADNKHAEEMFHHLSIASETLSDPAKKSAYDTLYKARLAQKRKLAAMDAHLRKARQDLDDREKAAKRAKDEAFMAQVQRKNEIDRLREEGMKKAQAAEDQRRQMSKAKIDVAVRQEKRRRIEEQASITDCTLKVKWKKKYGDLSVPELEKMFSTYGVLDKVIPSSKGKSNALVVFESVIDAFIAMRDQASANLQNVQISWAGGTEPPFLNDLDPVILSARGSEQKRTTERQQSPRPESPKQSTPADNAKANNNASTVGPAFDGIDDDYEMITLMKMRQAAANI